jgi:tetratricopeptide (TPR) repeat protein
MRQAAFLSVVLSFVVLPAVAFAQQEGDKIVVIRDNAPLRVNDQIISTALKGVVLVVKNANGDWLWVIDSTNGATDQTAKGWINRSDVIPYSQALDYFNEELKRNPTAYSYVTRGVIWREKGEVDLAISDFNDAIRIDPKLKDAYNSRGNCWREKGEYDKAIADYDEAMRLDPKAPGFFNNRGYAWYSKKEYDKAISDYNEAIRLDPNYPQPQCNRGRVREAMNEYDQAVTDYTEAIRLDPKYFDAYALRGRLWSYKDEYDKAIADYTEAIRFFPKYTAVYAARGDAWSSKKEYDKAIDDYTEAIRLNPKYIVAYLSRANAWKMRNDHDKAIADYDEAKRLAPKSAYVYNKLAWLYATCPDARSRDGRKAVDNATKACELKEWKDANSLDTLAAAYAETGDFDSAVNWQTKARDMASEREKADYQSRLDLYIAHKPYREEEKK